MSLQSTIKDGIKTAMLAKDTVRLTVLRNLTASFTNELVAKGKKPQEELSDEDALVVVKRLINQRKDSIDQFTKGGRPELAESEQAELDILNTFMPPQMSKQEIKKVAIAKKESMGITDKTKVNQLMGALMKDLKGKADGNDVKEVVAELFA